VNLEAYGGRRFIMTMGCGIACTALVWFTKISPEIFRDIIISTVAAYIAGNVVQKVKAPTIKDQAGG
jgi:hypothetical protein